MKKETFKMFTGNMQPIIKTPPLIMILEGMNDTVKDWIEMQTGLSLAICLGGYSAQPESTQQITRLLLTYNFKTRYFNNADYDNVLMLKFARDEDWDK